MRWFGRDWWLVGVWLALSSCAIARGQTPTTLVQDTVYRADGLAAAGSVVVSWAAFTTADGTAVAAGTTTVTLGSGGALSVALAPNAGAAPMGSFYTAVFHLSDGTVSKEFWVVPVSVPGGGAAKLAGIRNQVLPTSVALQTVSKAYVDSTVAKAATGTLPASAPWVVKTGDAMSGQLALAGDPVNANHAADKHYVDAAVATVFGASGGGHAVGAVPDPGTNAGVARFLREDATWVVPSGGGSGGTSSGSAGGDLSGSYPNPVVSAVHATSGTLDGVAVGQTTAADGRFTTGSFSGPLLVGSGTAAAQLDVIAPSSAMVTFAARTNPSYGVNQIVFDNLHGAGNFKNQFSLRASGVEKWSIGNDYGSNGGQNFYIYDGVVGAARLFITASGAVGIGTTTPGGLFAVGSSSQFQVDGSGNATAASYAGPAVAPTGSCGVSGAWVFSQDGHASFCGAGTWVVKI